MTTESKINYRKKNNSPSLRRQTISLSPLQQLFCLLYKKKSVALYINRKNNPEIARTKSHEKRKKSLLSYVIGQRNSSKKLDSLDQPEILLCHKRLCRLTGSI